MKKYSKMTATVTSFLFLATGKEAFADGKILGIYKDCPVTNGTDPNAPGPGAPELLCVVNNTIGIALEIVGALIVVVVIFAGIRYMTSMGNPERVAGAKKTLVGGIIGLIIVMLAWFVVRLVGNLIAPGSVK